jgi:hypothetical protein
MSMDPNTVQQLLAARLLQGPSAGSMGGQQGSISPMNAAANLTSKLMLMKALQGQQQKQQANAMLPGTNTMIAANPQIQALTQSPQVSPALVQQMQSAPIARPGVPSP